MIKELKKDNLLCKIYKTRNEMGDAAAEDIHNKILELLKEKEVINMIFAAAPSQNEVLASLSLRNPTFRSKHWFRPCGRPPECLTA